MRRLVSAVVALIVIIAGVAIYSAVHSKRLSATIETEIVPSGSTLVLNGKGIRSGDVRVKPGQYQLIGKHPGFADAKYDIAVKKGEKKYVGIILLSNSKDTANWYATHPEDRKKAEGISSKNFDASSSQNVADSPFILKLPFIAPGQEFRIDYGAPNGQSGGKSVIYIQAQSDEARADALTWIKGQGFDPSKMFIVYTGD